MLNIVIPMAGLGSRFSEVGYTEPKPLISVNGKSMIQLVIENLKPKIDHQFIFICRDEHLQKYNLRNILEKFSPGCKIISLNEVTEGAACTVLVAKEYIDNTDQLMIANCDQYIDIKIDNYLNNIYEKNYDGLIMTMKADDNKWSYIKINNNKEIIEVVEKVVVSDEATVGIYNFKRGSDFVLGANKMIQENLRVNNEFYVAPVYNQLIEKKMIIGYYNIGAVNNGMYGLGTPEDLYYFVNQKFF